MLLLPAGHPRPAQLHPGFRLQVGLPGGLAAPLRHDGGHRLAANPPPALGQADAVSLLPHGPGAHFELRFPAVQRLLLRPLVLHDYPDDGPGHRPLPGIRPGKLAAGHCVEHRHCAGHRPAHRPDAHHGNRRGNQYRHSAVRLGGLPQPVLGLCGYCPVLLGAAGGNLPVLPPPAPAVPAVYHREPVRGVRPLLHFRLSPGQDPE